MAEFKDFVAAVAVVISAASAGFAYYANGKANALKIELEQSKFGADTSIKLLEMTYTTLADADTPSKKIGACKYATSLAMVEKEALHQRNSLIEIFFRRMIEGDKIDANCALVVEEDLSGPPPAPIRPEPYVPQPAIPAPYVPEPDEGLADLPLVEPGPAMSPTVEPLPSVGTWQAVISSYKVNSKGCDYAKDDVAFFAPHLKETGLAGLRIGIFRTASSNIYAVSVDAGDDQALATKARDAIRSIADAQGKSEGADSFVQSNRNWSVDPTCQQTVIL